MSPRQYTDSLYYTHHALLNMDDAQLEVIRRLLAVDDFKWLNVSRDGGACTQIHFGMMGNDPSEIQFVRSDNALVLAYKVEDHVEFKRVKSIEVPTDHEKFIFVRC